MGLGPWHPESLPSHSPCYPGSRLRFPLWGTPSGDHQSTPGLGEMVPVRPDGEECLQKALLVLMGSQTWWDKKMVSVKQVLASLLGLTCLCFLSSGQVEVTGGHWTQCSIVQEKLSPTSPGCPGKDTRDGHRLASSQVIQERLQRGSR